LLTVAVATAVVMAPHRLKICVDWSVVILG
jgi:hypothetical protein